MSDQGAAPAERDLKIVQIACELGVDPSSVYRYVKDGFLRAYRLGDGRKRGPFRVTRTDVDEFKAGRFVLPERREAPLPRNPGHHAALLRLAELGALSRRNER